MELLLLVFAALVIAALYPIGRDLLRRRHTSDPAYVEGLQLLLDGEPDAAASRLKDAVSSDTSNVDAYIRLGDIYIARGDVARGVRTHENLSLRRNLKPSEERRVLTALARDYIRVDRKVKAMSLLEELERTNPRSLTCSQELLGLYIETASWEKAAELLRNASRESRDPVAAAQLYAEYARARLPSDPGAAMVAVTEALRLDPRCLAARIYQGDIELARGRADLALGTWTAILDQTPSRNGLVRDRIERALYEMGRYDDVTTLYERLLRKVPDDVGLAVALARIYTKMERKDDALGLLQRASESSGAAPQMKLALAELYLVQGELSRGKDLLAAARHLLEPDEPTCVRCGRVLESSLLRCPSCRMWQGQSS